MKKFLALVLALLSAATVMAACKKNQTNNNNLLDDDEVGGLNNGTKQTTDSGTGTATGDSSGNVTYTFTDVNEQVYVKNCNAVNLRKGPGTSYASVGSLAFGDGKTYTRVKYNETWSGLQIDGEIMYVYTKYLTTKQDFVVFDDISKTVVINKDPNNGQDMTLNARSFTDLTGDVLFTFKTGDEITVTGISKDGVWYRIKAKNKKGEEITAYMSANSKYSTEKKAESTTQAPSDAE